MAGGLIQGDESAPVVGVDTQTGPGAVSVTSAPGTTQARQPSLTEAVMSMSSEQWMALSAALNSVLVLLTIWVMVREL